MIETNIAQSKIYFFLKNITLIFNKLKKNFFLKVAIESGVNVTMVGRTEEKCEAARTKIFNGVNKVAKRKFATEADNQQFFIESTMNNLQFATEIFDSGLENADIIIEAVVENLKVKQKLFTDVENRVPR